MTISTKLIKLENIEVGSRLRDLRPDVVEEMAKSIKKGGLLQPIVIRPNPNGGYLLVVGRHRLEAERKLGYKAVECRIVKMDDAQALLAEIDENLVRADLTKKEINHHIIERKKLYEKLHPQTKQGGAPGKAGGGKRARTDEERQKVSSFAEDTAKKTGVSKRTVQRAVARAKAGEETKPKPPKKPKTKAVKPATDPTETTTGNDTDPQASADKRKAENAAAEAAAEAGEAAGESNPEPAPKPPTRRRPPARR
jgi:ParB family transcriptional regulator, chromosome partitioning protein